MCIKLNKKKCIIALFLVAIPSVFSDIIIISKKFTFRMAFLI